MLDRRFPTVADSMQDVAQIAHDVGLSLTQYNSGASRNVLNGFRLLRGTGRHDYFSGDHIAHLKSKAEVSAFLAGYIACVASIGSDEEETAP